MKVANASAPTTPVHRVQVRPAPARSEAELLRVAFGWARSSTFLAVLLFWALTRVAYAVLTYISVIFSTGYSLTTQLTLQRLINAWGQWDGIFYTRIATIGYTTTHPADISSFPLYPGLTHLVAQVIGPSNVVLAGLIVSNLGTLLAFYGVARLAQHEAGVATRAAQKRARRSQPAALASNPLASDALPRLALPIEDAPSKDVALAAVYVLSAYPLAFFMSAVYTDGLFLGFASCTLLCIRERRWWLASMWAFLATLTRPTGSILWLPLLAAFAWETLFAGRVWLDAPPPLRAWRSWGHWASAQTRELWQVCRTWWSPLWSVQGRRRARQRLRWFITSPTLLVIACVPLAFGVFALICAQVYGNPLAFVHAKTYFGLESSPPWRTLGLLGAQFAQAPMWSYRQARLLVDVLPIAMAVLVLALSIRRQPIVYTIYMLSLLYLILGIPAVHELFPDVVVGGGRFLLAAAPLWVTLGRWSQRYRWVHTLCISGGYLLQAALLVYFLNSGWLV